MNTTMATERCLLTIRHADPVCCPTAISERPLDNHIFLRITYAPEEVWRTESAAREYLLIGQRFARLRGFNHVQDGIAYNPPAAPIGLSANPASGPGVRLRWNENSEPDVWGYRLSYTPISAAAPLTVDVGPANATQLVIPAAGQWRVTASAYAAMGRLSAPGSGLTITIAVDAAHVYLPLIRK